MLPVVRVVVLNWNAAGLTGRCVESLLRTDYPSERLEVVIVDNGSIDGSVPTLQHRFPELRIIENGENLGFAEGCNRALRDLDGVDAVALVNNDATVEPGWLRPLVERLQSDPSVGAVAPKMLLADSFVTVVIQHEGPGRVRVDSVAVDGREVLDRSLPGEGVVSPPHPSQPLRLHREVADRGELHVPVDTLPASVTLRLSGSGLGSVSIGAASADGSGDGVALDDAFVETTVVVPGPSHRRINSLGTGLTPWNEGYERRFGERDSVELVSEDVDGWSGGGVLLRAQYLSDVGLFDPTFFAYYEDTDLSWRGRRGGWRTVTEPASVVHHLHGATAGSSWPGFFFLNYRNWLLTVLRNGNVRQIGSTIGTAWGISWPFARRNVVGRLRRAQRPDWAITARWLRVAVGLVPTVGPVWWSRRRGAPAVGRDRSEVPWATKRLLGSIAPRPPQSRPAGPLVVYVDVTETLRAGWRAGIQRVVTRLVGEMTRDATLDVVPVTWSPLDRAWRRLDREETGRLFQPPPMRNHPVAPNPPTGGLRGLLGPVTRLGPLKWLKDEIRRRRALRDRGPEVTDLVLARFEPGAVFFDPDASWNVVDAARSGLLPMLRAGGLSSVAFVHDVLPMTNPEWFDPNLARVFEEHVVAHLRAGSLLLCNSRHTALEIGRVAADMGLAAPRTLVVGLGSDARDLTVATTGGDHESTPVRPEIAEALAERPHVLVVGTIEPRKNHTGLLDAFEKLLADGQDVGLVIVGRLGWRADDVGRRIMEHGEYGRRLFWPSSVDDAELTALYRQARVVVVPSITEGFGLPVAEALSLGSVVISSAGGALPEIGGDAVLRFDPADPSALAAAIHCVIVDDDAWSTLSERSRHFVAPTWSEVAASVSAAVRHEATSRSASTPT